MNTNKYTSKKPTRVCNLSETTGQLPRFYINVENEEAICMADTGASISIINNELASKLKAARTVNTDVKIKVANGTFMHATTAIVTRLTMGQITLPEMQFVICPIQDSMILGMDTMKVVTVNQEQGHAVINGVRVELINRGRTTICTTMEMIELEPESVTMVQASNPVSENDTINEPVVLLETPKTGQMHELELEVIEGVFTNQKNMVVPIYNKWPYKVRLQPKVPIATGSTMEDTDAGYVCNTLIQVKNDKEHQKLFKEHQEVRRRRFQPETSDAYKTVIIGKQLDDWQRQEAAELLRKERVIFSTNAEDIGMIRNFKFAVPWVKESNEVYVRPRPVPPKHKTDARSIIKQWLRMGVIENASSANNSPMFFIKKSKGGGLRPVLDCRQINLESTNMRFPIPHLSDLIADVSQTIGSTKSDKLYISSSDIQSAYNQLVLKKEDRHKVAFSFENRQYQPVRTLFGLKCAPASFCEFMAHLVDGLEHTYVLLDDILIVSTDWKDHMAKLSKFFERVKEAGLTLKPSKTYIATPDVEYLGFKLSKSGIEPLDAKVKPILDFPTPRSKKEVRRFVGMCNFYRKFVPRGHQILGPLYKICGTEPYKWTTERQEAFEQYKQQLANYVKLVHRDTSKKLVLVTDGSTVTGIAGALHQMSSDGVLEPLGFVSRQLQPCEKRLASRYIELIAIIWSLRQFHWELTSEDITIMTDHYSLQNILNEREIKIHQPIRIQNAMAELSRHNLTIIHRTNKDPAIIALDAFSRAIPVKEEQADLANDGFTVDRGVSNMAEVNIMTRSKTTANVSDGTEPDAQVDQTSRSSDMVKPRSEVGSVEPNSTTLSEDIRLAPSRKTSTSNTTTADPLQSDTPDTPKPLKIRKFARKPWDEPALVIAELQYSYDQIKKLQEEDNEIKRKIQTGKAVLDQHKIYVTKGLRWNQPVMLVPAILARELISFLHVKTGHPGAERLTELVKRKFHIMDIHNISLEVCSQMCEKCVINKPKPAKRHPEPPQPDFATMPWTRCYVDLCDFGRTDTLGNRYFLGIEDHFSRFLDGQPLPDKRAETVAYAMAQILLRNNANNCQMVLDNGLEFAGPEVIELLKSLNIKTSHISPYMPNGNKIERLWRELGIRAKIEELEQNRWSKDIFVLLWQINNLPNSNIGGLTPFEVLTGRPFKFPCFPEPVFTDEGSVNETEWVAYLSRWLFSIGENMTNKAREKMEQMEPPKRKTIELKIDDRVAFWAAQRVGQTKKLYRAYGNDGVITRILGNGSYEIKDSNNRRWVRNVRMIRLLPPDMPIITHES